MGPVVLGLLLMALGGAAAAQNYPSKPMRMLIPAGPGGGVDTVARLVGQGLSAAMGEPVVMENRPGAGTTLASEATAKAPPDGYTMLMMTNSHAINASLHRNLRYDPVNDFALAALVASVPYWVVVHPSVPARSVKELIALARKRPGELYFASAGAGSGTHLAGELLIAMANVKMVHVPHVEAGTAVDAIDDILALDGLRIVMLAMTDLSKALGHPFQYEHPDVWRRVDGIVARARSRGVVVAANMLENFAKPLLSDIRTATA